MKPINIFIVDDHPIVRAGISQAINKEGDMRICGEADKGDLAMAEIARLEPDIALVDLSLDDDSGLELIQQLTAAMPKVKVLVVSMHDELVYIKGAFQAKAQGYFCKKDNVCNIPIAIRKILSGENFYSDAILKKITAISLDEDSIDYRVDQLSRREKEILRCLGEGIKRKRISKELFISPKTVNAHIENIKSKLNLSSAEELTRYAVQLKNKNII